MIKKLLITAFALTLISTGIYLAYSSSTSSKHPVPVAVDYSNYIRKAPVLAPVAKKEIPNKASPKKVVPKKTVPEETVPPEPVVTLPEELNLSMPFYTQAPFGDWGYPWQEACEEATMLLIANEVFKKHWTKEQFNQQILDMVDWQNEHLGYYRDTTMAENKRIMEEELGLKTVMHENPTLEDIKIILANGHFIVMPLDGKLIRNPYFSNGGPVYHVLVVKGYTKDNGLITHDVGTRRGADYVYTWDILDKALHDFAVPMSKGGRRILEVLPAE